ncbi:hypothetical protein SEA_DRHAYES_73 [Mycobacterium phage DrHayes]|uniref:Uncharacterized protein n=1 Tax=Mycobacterium phage Urkel TaxID=1912978 RepID=A0A1I9S4V4_9CAUD|nr:hypothetical protein I5H07_gp30 [Mycobacterium phage Urkel]AOZ61404.1 hypothetical protein SEA_SAMUELLPLAQSON_73 [Mycobacterium phage SamuelLPlaqson]AOZ61501.1 hypothetical protein SEA_DRHAYES_73 [Mycobacterium phage DrHayes]AOZ61598.1 hypothetical protein SEA_URKEL_73 [Mycobacterium phage Urkel]
MSLPGSPSFGDPRRSPGTPVSSPAISHGLSYYGSPRPTAPSELDVVTPAADVPPAHEGKCRHCGAEALTPLCWSCTRMLRRQLVEVPWLLRRLQESAYGEAKVARKGGPRVSTGERLPSLPLNTRAADMLRDAARLVSWWEQVSGVDRGGLHDAARVEAAARWLSGEPGAMMSHPWAPEALGWVLQWRQDAERVIDLPPDLQYAGPCQAICFDEAGHEVECSTPLYVDSEALAVDCYRCGMSWRVEDLQRQALDRVDEAEPRTAADMWRLFKLIGRDVPRSTFYRLMTGVEACGYRDGYPTYTYGAVVAALDEYDRKAAERRAAGKAKRGRPRKLKNVDAHTEGVDVQTVEALPSAPKQVTG